MAWVTMPTSTSTNVQKWAFKNQFYDAGEEKTKLINGCDAEWPPPSNYFDIGTVTGITFNSSNATFSFSGVASWAVDPSSGCTGQRFSGYICPSCIAYIPEFYDLCPIQDYDDQWTWLRSQIIDQTFDGNSGTGTLVVPLLPLINAVTAGFIPSLASLGSAKYRITKRHTPGGGDGLTSRDRRPLKPNEEEQWRGTVVTGWIDTDGNGILFQQTNDVDPQPYLTDFGALPPVGWKKNEWTLSEALFFDSTSLLYRQTVSANDSNHLAFNKSIYKVTVTATSGTFELSAIGTNASGGGITPAFNATASVIQTGLDALVGMSGKVTVSGSGPFTVTFDASLGFVNLTTLGGVTIGAPDGSQALGGAFTLVVPGNKGMPGRVPEAWETSYSGAKQGYQTHMEDGTIGSVPKPLYSQDWLEGNICAPDGCNTIGHNVFDVDAQISFDSNCEPGRAGDWIAPDFYKTWRGLQIGILNLWSNFVNVSSPFGGFTDINIAGQLYKISDFAGYTRKWDQRHRYNTGKGRFIADTPGPIDPPAITPGGGALPDPAALGIVALPSHPLGVVLGQSGNMSEGITCSYITALTNGSGHTDASTATTITTTSYVSTSYNTSTPILTATYSTTLTWQPVSGASQRDIYVQHGGSGSELLTISVADSLGTWTDDGSLTPSGASPPTTNTTHNDCFGTGFWNFRPQSIQYLSITTDGFINDGGGGNVSTGSSSRVDGDNYLGAFSGRGPILSTTILDDAFYWDGFARTHHRLSIHLQKINQSSGTIVWANKYMIFDPSKKYYDDGINNGTIMRVQGGQFNAGGGTTATDTNYNNSGTGKACWFLESRYTGSHRISELVTANATPFAFFIMEIYSGGKPAGWDWDATGNATFITPVATGHTGSFTNGSNPSIISMNSTSGSLTNTLLHSTGLPQPVFIQGTNFNTSGMHVTLTSPDTLTVISRIPTAVTTGELTLGDVVFDRDQYGTWNAVATDPISNLSSGSFAFDVKQMQEIPIESFAGPTFTFAATLDTAAAALDGYLIKEYNYEQDNRSGRVIRVTPVTGDPVELIVYYNSNTSLFYETQSNAPTGTFAFKEIVGDKQLEYGGTYLLSTTKPTVAQDLIWYPGPPNGSTPRYWVQPTGSGFSKYIWNNVSTIKTGTGFYQLGDIWGPWIADDLKALLIQMQVTKKSYIFSLEDTDLAGNTSGWHSIGYSDTLAADGIGYSARFSGGPPTDFSSAVGIILADDATAGATAVPDTGPGTLGPLSGTGMIGNGQVRDVTIIPLGDISFYGQTVNCTASDGSSQPLQQDGSVGNLVSAAKNKGKITGLPQCYSASVQFWAYGGIDAIDSPPEDTTTITSGGRGTEKVKRTFDPMGNSIIYHLWSEWSSAGNADPVFSSSYLGNLAVTPDFSSDDPAGTAPGIPSTCNFVDLADVRGWYPLNWVAIIVWSGLTYV